jgi:hypothetical protein
MLSRLLAALCFIVLLSSRMSAQTSGAIIGSVQDASGAAVVGATVSILDVNKGTSQVFKTDESGAYSAPFLIPGTYRVTVEAPGFKRATSQDIVLDVDARQRADFTMQIGQASETVEVTAAAPLVRSESAELGEVIGQKAVENLPLNGRNFAQLVYLVPGVTPGQQNENLSGSSTFNPRASSNFNALGSQANANGWLVDGIIDNEYTFNTVMVQPSVESVQEFKVLTGTFSAEYGRGAGIVLTQTRSGSNAFHGSVFEFLRNNYFDARNYFNATIANGKPNPQPPFRRNQYGASLGGPIFKNRTFFFADYYGQREIKGNTFLTTVPTAQEHTGNFSDLGVNIYNPFTAATRGGARALFPNNTIPANLINPVSQRVIDLYPLPNLAGINNNRLDVFNRNLKDNGGNLRIDQHFSEKDSFFARYSYEAFDLFDAKGQSGCCYATPASAAGKYDLGPFVSGGQITTLRASGLALNETHVFSPTIVNEFIAGYTRTNPLTTQSDFGHNAATSLGINGINLTPFTTGIPTIVPTAAGNQANVQALNGGPGFLPAHPVQTSYQLQDGVSWTVGVHQMNFGYRIIQNRVSPFTNTNTRGTLNFGLNFTNDPITNTGGDGFATLLLGYLTSGSRGFLLSPYYLTNYEHAAWFQDNWKVTPRLTLNLGLRWEVFTPATEQQNRLTNFDRVNLRLVYAGLDTSNTAGLQTRWNNLGPRFGFAYDADGKGTTVLRGGFGTSYFPLEASASNMLGQQVPWTISQNTPAIDTYPAASVFANVPTIAQPFPTPVPVKPLTTADLIAANPSILGRDFHNQTPYYESWNFNIERQIGKDTLAELGYAGSHGVHLLFGYNPQEILPGPASVSANDRITIPAIATVRNILQEDFRNSSNFHSLQAKLTKRLSNGVQFLASYTWSKSLDYGGSIASGGGAAGGPQTITNLRAGYGPSGFDVRHRFVGSWSYELPFGPGRHWLTSGIVSNILGGWDLDGIATVSTGRPFTVYLSSGVTNGAPSWPDRIASGQLPNPTRARWYDPTAFVAPSTPRYGNEGRSVLYSPGFTNFDLSLVKNFSIIERLRAQFRVDAFNAFNHPQFGFPNQTVNTGNPAKTDTSIASTITDNRDLQLSIRLVF